MDAWSYSNVCGYASKVLVEILQVRAMPSMGEHSVSERYGRKNRERPRVLFLAEMSNEGKKHVAKTRRQVEKREKQQRDEISSQQQRFFSGEHRTDYFNQLFSR